MQSVEGGIDGFYGYGFYLFQHLSAMLMDADSAVLVDIGLACFVCTLVTLNFLYF